MTIVNLKPTESKIRNDLIDKRLSTLETKLEGLQLLIDLALGRLNNLEERNVDHA